MKFKLIFILMLCVFGQLLTAQTITKLSIQQCHSIGSDIVENIKSNETEKLLDVYDKTELQKLLNLPEIGEDNRLFTDIYYDYVNKVFVLTIISGKSVDNGTDWGLYAFRFISTLKISWDGEVHEIVDSEIIVEDSQKKKLWWQSLMVSYRDPKCLRKEWAEKFGLVPPPPLPPETAEWYK